jgi:hypothetical protein
MSIRCQVVCEFKFEHDEYGQMDSSDVFYWSFFVKNFKKLCCKK